MKIKNAAAIAVLLLLCGCTVSENNVSEKELFAMDTYMKFTAYGDNSEAALSDVCEKVEEFEKLFSVTDENSDISRINTAHGSAVNVSADTENIISRSLEISRLTDGSADMTVYPLVRAWGFTTGEYAVPSEDIISGLLDNTGYENITLSENSVTVPEGFQLDLGSIAKGYAGEICAEMLKDEGISSAILNLGGNIQTVGEKPDGSPWKVAVTDPFSQSDIICTVEVRDKAVVTSGNYQRYFIADNGKKYCHIIDPKTGYPADNGLASVTIIGDSGTYCDGLSTALFVMGKEKAADFWKVHRDFDMIMIEESGNVLLTENIYESTVFSDSENITGTEVIN